MISKENIEVNENFPLDECSTMQVPCTAKYFIIAEDKEGVKYAIDLAEENNLPLLVLGGGSNVIFISSYYDGVVLKLGDQFKKIEQIDAQHIEVGCAANLNKVLSYCKENSMSGLEFTVGIPGTLGGAIRGNAGAGNFGICQYVSAISGIDFAGNNVIIKQSDFKFTYRWSSITNAVLCSAILKLHPSTSEKINERIGDYISRRANQPVGVKSAGCVFKNPMNDTAGRLIEAAGLKGYRIGGAAVSSKHANYIINDGDGHPADFLELIEYIRKIVYSKFEIKLQLEVDLI